MANRGSDLPSLPRPPHLRHEQTIEGGLWWVRRDLFPIPSLRLPGPIILLLTILFSYIPTDYANLTLKAGIYASSLRYLAIKESFSNVFFSISFQVQNAKL